MAVLRPFYSAIGKASTALACCAETAKTPRTGFYSESKAGETPRRRALQEKSQGARRIGLKFG